MSAPAYVSLTLGIIFVVATYVIHPDPRFLLNAAPMLLILAAVPVLFNVMNKKRADEIDLGGFKLYKIKNLAGLEDGTPVRLQGKVETASLKWLNRAFFRISDGSGEIGVFMFTAPPKDIKPGDIIEVAGSLRPFGFTKEKRLWGVKIEKC
jgi:hypothetical protein